MPIPPRRAQKVGTKFLSEALADNARQIRGLRKLSQDDVAERMTALGHTWSRQTTSDVERNLRNVTVDELLGLALVLGAPIGQLLDPRGVLQVFRTAIDPGDPDLPYTKPRHIDNPTPIEIPGTAGMGIPPAALQALIESRVTLSLAWDGKPAGIGIEPVADHFEDFVEIVDDFRNRGADREAQG